MLLDGVDERGQPCGRMTVSRPLRRSRQTQRVPRDSMIQTDSAYLRLQAQEEVNGRRRVNASLGVIVIATQIQHTAMSESDTPPDKTTVRRTMSDEWDWRLTDSAERTFVGLVDYARGRVVSKLDEVVEDQNLPTISSRSNSRRSSRSVVASRTDCVKPFRAKRAYFRVTSLLSGDQRISCVCSSSEASAL